MKLTAEQTFSSFLKNRARVNADTPVVSLMRDYFNLNLDRVSVTILEHYYQPDCYRCPALSDDEPQVRDFLLNRAGIKVKPGERLIRLDTVYLFPLADEDNKVHYLVVFSPSSVIKPDFLDQLCAQVESIWRFTNRAVSINNTRMAQKTIKLASRLSHDLNGLASLSLAVADQDDALQDKIDYSHRLSHDIMFYLRDLTLQAVSVPVKDLLEGIVENFPLTVRQRINLNFIHIPALIQVDVEHIENALSSIVENAITAAATQESRIRLSVDRQVNNSMFMTYDWLKIAVDDDGIGIPAEFLTEVKKPLFTTWKDLGHIGLGLSQAEKIIHAHGGALIIESKPGAGTTTTLYLPINDGEK